MFTEFVLKKLKTARYEKIEDGTYFGTIPSMRGVWGNGRTIAACREDLRGAFKDWLMFKIYDHEKIPGLKMNFEEPALSKAK